MSERKYWIAAISKEHILRGVADSFIQVCHGKQGPLKRMRQGDIVIVYSSKVSMQGDDKLQAFTAMGEIADENVYEFAMTEQFVPFRRKVNFMPCRDAPIQPLINSLNFIPDKKHWGYPFRYGLLQIGEEDYELIAREMACGEGKSDNLKVVAK